eukprot:TRINITY_DN1025_c0_g1_i3.p1 TRINITY_DN1025_c0_g1~~TRINITY_DN1025_c0_g1_i3.p1  ORF type:complete len:399 (+),score=30.44 TRINITY_DN1025_c0_g1_i3:87-1283(+)
MSKASEDPLKLTVLTYNVFHDINAGFENAIYKRAFRQCQALLYYHPHVLCLQEMFDSRVKQIYEDMLASKYFIFHCPDSDSLLIRLRAFTLHLIYILIPALLLLFCELVVPTSILSLFSFQAFFQTIYLGSRLKTHGFLFVTCYLLWRWILVSRWKTVLNWFQEDSIGLMILLAKNKFELVEDEPDSFSWFFFNCQKGDLLNIIRQRGAMSVTARLKPSCFGDDERFKNVKIQVLNTHLNTGISNPQRILQLQEMLGEYKLQSNTIQICCMDANAHDDRPEMKWLFSMGSEGAGFIDTWREKHKRKELNDDNPENGDVNNDENSICEIDYDGYTWNYENPFTRTQLQEPDQRVDYIGVRQEETSSEQVKCVIDRSELVFEKPPYLSDHYGVLTTFHLM